MKVVLQRVSSAEVKVAGEVRASIGAGMVLFLGIGPKDTPESVEALVRKILNLRIFEDAEGKMNRSVLDRAGEILIVSQFTLYADCKKGNRPSFTGAASPDQARRLYDIFIEKMIASYANVQTGVFGADMKVGLVNDGPVTILLESEQG